MIHTLEASRKRHHSVPDTCQEDPLSLPCSTPSALTVFGLPTKQALPPDGWKPRAQIRTPRWMEGGRADSCCVGRQERDNLVNRARVDFDQVMFGGPRPHIPSLAHCWPTPHSCEHHGERIIQWRIKIGPSSHRRWCSLALGNALLVHRSVEGRAALVAPSMRCQWFGLSGALSKSR